MLYRTNFKLVADVTDVDAANKYLKMDDMTEFLLGKYPHLRDTVAHIEWTLDESREGHIDLATVRELSPDELKTISEWVSGQNSDGLGEGFEQQPFASYEIEDDYNYGYDEDEYIEPEYVTASFDWEKNDYEFTLVTPKQDLEFDAAINDLSKNTGMVM